MEKYTFFNDDNDDRIYFAEDFARHLATFFTNGVFNNGCKVLAENNDMSVNIGIGSANINGYRYDNDSIKILSIENADGVLNRIDNIVIRLDLTNRIITTQVIKGTFSDKPVAPELVRTSTIYDLRIAKINVPAGVTMITSDLITDTRFTTDCGNVTQAVLSLDTEDIFKQYEETFRKWFSEVQADLDGDIAGNLSNRIYELYSKIDAKGEIIDSLDSESTKDAPSIRSVKEYVDVRITTDGAPVKTGRIIDGKIEYLKRISCPNMGNSGELRQYPTGIDVPNSIITDIRMLSASSSGNWMPFPNNGDGDSRVLLNINGSLSIIHYTGNWNGSTGYAEITYLKKQVV